MNKTEIKIKMDEIKTVLNTEPKNSLIRYSLETRLDVLNKQLIEMNNKESELYYMNKVNE